MEALGILPLVIVGFGAWLLYRMFIKRRTTGSSRTRRTTRTTRAADGDGFAVEVVGESHYQRELESLVGGREEDSAEEYVTAMLVPENSNPHDSKAVRVEVQGKTVGYLSRQDARQWRKVTGASSPQQCPAVIVGGWDRGGTDQGHFGIRLDLAL